MDSSPLKLDEARQTLTSGTGKGVRIAALDSGIEVNHPGLVGRELADNLHVVDSGIWVEMKSWDGTDIFGHGTAIAGVIRRIAPDAGIGSIRVLVRAWPRVA